jgi:hypothetical protein
MKEIISFLFRLHGCAGENEVKDDRVLVNDSSEAGRVASHLRSI